LYSRKLSLKSDQRKSQQIRDSIDIPLDGLLEAMSDLGRLKDQRSSQPTDATPSKAKPTKAPEKKIRETPRVASKQEPEAVSVKLGDRFLSFLVLQLALFLVHQSKLAYFVTAAMFYIVYYK